MWLLCCVLFVAFCYLEGKNYHRTNFNVQLPEKSDVCLSKGCVLSAATLIQNMDESANPCDDFYQYACGGFETRTPMPDEKMKITAFSSLEEDVYQRLRVLVEKPKRQSEPKSFWKIKDIYLACVNMRRIEVLGSKPLEDLLESVGGWPVVSGKSWMEDDFDWVKTMYKFRNVGVSVDYLFRLSIDMDLKNLTQRLITLDQPSLGMLDRAYLLKGFSDPLVNAYYQLMVNVAVRLGASKDEAEDQLKQSLEFEMKLAIFSLPREETRSVAKLYHKMTVDDLNNLSSKINWLEYLSTILPVEINSSEPVVVTVPQYLKYAVEFTSSAPKRTVANYLMWRVALDNIANLDKKFRRIYMVYVSKLSGQMQETARWLQCMIELTSAMPIALGSMYIREYFNENAKQAAIEMITDIRNEFEETLNDITWMNRGTKIRALEKLRAVSQQIAYPDELLNDTLIDDLYANLSVTPCDHFGNIMSIRIYNTNYSYSLLREPFNKTDWRCYGDTRDANAYYFPRLNTMYLPAAILQGIFLDSNRPNYVNYGAIGFVIGHEITHGFDDQGKLYDKDGNLNNWWDKSTDKMFEKKVRCIIEQYSNFTVKENAMKVDGVNTQSENIADNGGLKEAYLAYQKWVTRNGVEPVLPGINLTQQQLFWLSYANIMCNAERPEAAAIFVMTGEHSPNRFRVNGPMSNSVKFSEDFNCPKGSPMNPSRKCAVW